jgi:hypothetical protein
MDVRDGESYLKRRLSDPPRDVPLLLAVQLLVGGPIGFIGWFFLGFGMIFVWVFAMNTDPAATWAFRGTLLSAPGMVTSADNTHFSEGEDGPTIFSYRYHFDYAGKSYEGQSYQPGAPAEAGMAVVVEFPEGRPERSRIRGMQSAPMPAFALFVILFPLIGSLFVVGRWRAGWRNVQLLKHGHLTHGKLVSQEATNTTINDQRVYKLTFEFDTDAGHSSRISVNTHETQRLLDDPLETLLYDPTRPTRGTTLDHLPGEPTIDEQGEIVIRSSRLAYLTLVVPVLTVFGHGAYVLFHYVL